MDNDQGMDAPRIGIQRASITPVQHAAAKSLFARAVELPPDQRNAFLAASGVNDADVLAEVQSLLQHVNEVSLIETIQMAPGVGEAGTIEMPLHGSVPSVTVNAGAPSLGLKVEKAVQQPGSDLQARMDASMRKLLRGRLLVAVVALLIVVICIRTAVWFFGDSEGQHTFHFVPLAVLFGIAWFLRSNQQVSLKSIRLLLIVIIAIPMVELMVIQVEECNRLVSVGRLNEIPLLNVSVSFATSVLIGLFATFLPSTWKRTAIIGGAMALTPSITAWVHGTVTDGLAEARMVPFISPVLTILSAAIAAAGAHFMNRARLLAEDSRSYGQYSLLDEIGRGGMGVVYRAEHRMLKRPAAIKLIRAESAAEQEVIKQFEQEVQISATLTHWNTVQIFDYGTTQAGDFFYVMEFLNGDTLEVQLNRNRFLTQSATVLLLKQICDGLAEAHQRGMIHRDLKPANVFLAKLGGQSDVVKIVDFGLAVVAHDSRSTRVAGTPGYMSPEQIRGDSLDGRSDIYAIGCILVKCVTGTAVFQPGTVSTELHNHLFRMPNLGQLEAQAPMLLPIAKKCLAKQPEQRYRDVRELKQALEEVTQ